LIAPIASGFLRTIGGEFTEPIDNLGITATGFNQPIQAIAAGALALAASHAQYIELADEIAEYDGAVAGHAWPAYSLREHFGHKPGSDFSKMVAKW
jgi:hypothetical protein